MVVVGSREGPEQDNLVGRRCEIGTLRDRVRNQILREMWIDPFEMGNRKTEIFPPVGVSRDLKVLV